MRLAPFTPDMPPNPVAGDATLDEILAANADRRPLGRALHAPELPFDGVWREVDRAVSALAETFTAWGLGEDATVGVQLGSTPHAALTCLGLWRAGLVPAMLPLAWRRREIGAALACVGASAIVSATKGGGANPAQIGCEVASGLETIRFVGSFGADVPDGATPLDGALQRPAARYVRSDRPDDAADHVAVVTFDAGGAPVARSHNELVAAGFGPVMAARLTERSTLVSTLDLSGLGGLATGLAPWLLTGGAACFHPVSTTQALAGALSVSGASHIALPGRIAAAALADCGAAGEGLSVTALWRAPDGRGAAPDLPGAQLIVDAFAFGELGLYAAARAAHERHATLPLGPAGPAERVGPLIDLKVAPDGRLFIRGAACPQAPCPASHGAPTLAFDPEGYVETGLAAIADRGARRVAIGGRRRGVIQIGGLALSLADVEQAYTRSGVRGRPALFDDAVFGQRLTLADADETFGGACEALDAAGFGPAVGPVPEPLDAARRIA